MKSEHNPMYYNFDATGYSVGFSEIFPDTIDGTCTVNGIACAFTVELNAEGEVEESDIQPPALTNWEYNHKTLQYVRKDDAVGDDKWLTLDHDTIHNATVALHNWVDEKMMAIGTAASAAAEAVRVEVFPNAS